MKRENSEIYNIAIAPNKPYANYMMVLMQSLFETNSDKKLFFYVLYHELSERERNRIQVFVETNGADISFVLVENELFSGFPLEERFSSEAYFRLIVQDVLPKEVDRLLYLDCDMIVTGDINELYHTELEDKYFAACGFSTQCECGDEFNSGMLLFDMEKMRRDISLKTYQALTKRLSSDFYLDQALLNAQFAKDGVKYVWKQKYNFTCPFYRKFADKIKKEMPSYTLEDIVVVHFAGPGIRPWQMCLTEEELKRLDKKNLLDFFAMKGYLIDKLYVHFLEMWWHYAEKTPCYEWLLFNMEKKKNQIYSEVLMAVIESKEYKIGYNLLQIPRRIKRYLKR